MPSLRSSSRTATTAAPAPAATTTATPPTPAATTSTLAAPVVQNVVSTCFVGCRLDLQLIAQQARNAEYNAKRFSACIVRIREPKSTALVFSTGKLVVTGAKSEDDSRLAARKFARIIQSLGFKVTFQDWKVQNLVSSCDSQLLIRLEGLSSGPHFTFCRYEPEIFPGLVYRMQEPSVVLLVFAKGKVVITGAKTKDDITRAWNNLYPALLEYRILR